MFIKINDVIVNKNTIKTIYINSKNNIIFRFNSDIMFDEIVEEHSSKEEAEKAFNEWVNKLC